MYDPAKHLGQGRELWEQDGWLYSGRHKVCLVGAYRKSENNCAFYVIHKGYEIRACLLSYSQSMLEKEIPKYRRGIAMGNRDRLIPELEWMEYRVKYFKTLKLLKGEDQ